MKYRPIISSAVGGGLEYYDFLIFGFLFPFFAPLFFNTNDESMSLMLAYTTFAIGFIFRPIGAIIFGHLGDRHGRKTALIYSIFLMILSMSIMITLPVSNKLGMLAPIFL